MPTDIFGNGWDIEMNKTVFVKPSRDIMERFGGRPAEAAVQLWQLVRGKGKENAEDVATFEETVRDWVHN
ncbi:unnamed protein product [Peniophora sp. CBMAI 1063]|nr:unnamed protein product [Peniophora sp. CBMAI 1063]